MTVTVTLGGEPVAVEVTRSGARVHGAVGATPLDATHHARGRRLARRARRRHDHATVVRERDAVWVAVDGEVYRCAIHAAAESAGGAASIRSPHVIAPMPGKVLEVRVEAGQPSPPAIRWSCSRR